MGAQDRDGLGGVRPGPRLLGLVAGLAAVGLLVGAVTAAALYGALETAFLLHRALVAVLGGG
ncbi:hypothetical protein ACWGB8_05780 [Kitasatospora sp. NPDC054939]